MNPRMTVGQIIGEGLTSHGIFKRGDPAMKEYIMKVMEDCGLASYMFNRYPHQFSGGQRQRIGIARSLALSPKFVVCDEAVSALDVSIQSQILNLLSELREKAGLTYLFITHDLSVVKYISDRICVMYLGNMVELSESEELFKHTYHPVSYTHLQLNTPKGEKLDAIPGSVPNPLYLPQGCKFAPRCKYCTQKCQEAEPTLHEVEPGHVVRCFYPEKAVRKEHGE